MAKRKQKRNPWRTKGKGTLRLRKGACVATIGRDGSWSVTDGRVQRGGWGKSPTEAKRRARAGLNSCNRDYDDMAEQFAYQRRHEGGFAGVGFFKLFAKETPDNLAEEQLGKARRAYEEAMIAASQERCSAALTYMGRGGDAYMKSPPRTKLTDKARKLHDATYELSKDAHTMVRRNCR